MASGTTLRVLVVLIIFFSLGFGLYSIAIAESPTFFTSGMTGTGPTGFGSTSDPSKLLAWNVTNAISQLNSSASGNHKEYDIVDWHTLSFKYCTITNTSGYILAEFYDKFFWGTFGINAEDLDWKDVNTSQTYSLRVDPLIGPDLGQGFSHIVIPVSTLDNIYNGWGDMAGYSDINYLQFKLENSKGSVWISMFFNESAYLLPRTALQGQGIYISIKQSFSDRQTSVNLLGFISGLFSFTPVAGLPYPINLFVSFIWYGCIGALIYIIFTIVKSILPFVSRD